MNFAANERVLAYHGPMVYEAKVLKTELWKEEDNASDASGPHYLVHYKGWKQTWDEYVPETRLLKLNDENLAQQKELQESARAKSGEEPGSATLSTSTATKKKVDGPSTSRQAKRGRESMTVAYDTEEAWQNRPEIKLSIPDALKVQLVDDWEAVTKNNQIVPLPRSPNVQEIIQAYQDETLASAKQARSPAITKETMAGLQLYFDKCLGNNLLYRFERTQYGEIRKKHGDDAEMSTIYGAEHLLRLFVNIPELVAHTQMDAESVALLREALQDLLKWLSRDRNKYLLAPLDEYENTSTTYQNLARV